jgi:3-oxoacyl-[acyl-carrier protein] reductase
MRFANKVAVVTGAGSGFGEGIARRLAGEGAKVVVADINEAGGRRVAAEIGAAAVFHHADVSKSADVKAMVGTAVARFGRLDVLVNNAGFTHKNMPMLEVPEDVFDKVYATNVKSIYLGAIHAVPVMRRQGSGVIVNVASTAGVRPRPGLTWYNGSKGAAIVLTKSMAAELAPDKIRVCAVNPVAGETGMLKDFMGQDTPEVRARFVATIPLGRLSQPRDIAAAVAFLASDDAEFLTGVCLEVDGGRCI